MGVFEAARLAWVLVRSDYWRLWLVGFVCGLLGMATGFVGCVPCVGPLIASLFLQAQLGAGLFYAVRVRMDGGAAEVPNLFAGFSQRYMQSLVAWAPVSVAVFIATVVTQVMRVGIQIGVMVLLDQSRTPENEAMAVGIGLGGAALLLLVWLAVGVFALFFTFALLAVWDYPASGWEAVRVSARLVRQHFFRVLGFALLVVVISLAAVVPFFLFGTGAVVLTVFKAPLVFTVIVGCVALLVGLATFVLIGPAVTVWSRATLVCLYRSWTGQPLSQPAVASGPPAGGGPIPPTSIEPPAGV